MTPTAAAVIAGVVASAAATAWATVRFGSWRMLALGATALAAGVALAVWRYSQREDPPWTACALPSVPGELGSICGFENPEDLDYARSLGLLLVSEEGFGGRLLSLDLADLAAGPRVLWPAPPDQLAQIGTRRGDSGDADCPFPSDPSALSPHGLSVLESSEPGAPVRVAFDSHRLVDGRVTDAIQLFDLARDGRTLAWRGCIAYPADVIGNDIAYLRDGSLVATNFAPRGTLAQLERSSLRGALGLATGDVLRWSRDGGWSHLPDTGGALPNGIAMAADERALYFSDAGREQVAIVPLAGGAISRVRVGGAPNNLTVSASGDVLATGATLSGELPFLCNLGGRECRAGWAVWRVDPRALTAREILADDGGRIANATTALQIEDTLYIGSMVDDRVGVYRLR